MLYYVYLHYDGDEVVYVGRGTGGRCWDTHGTRRSEKHKNWMLKQLPFLKYEIVFTSTDKSETLKVENELTKKYSPRYDLLQTNRTPLSEKERQNCISRINKVNQIKKRCEHCQGEFSSGMYSRWHGNNCKARKDNNG